MPFKRGKKPRIDPVRWQPPPTDELPDFSLSDLTVVPVGGNAPEDVVVDADGQIWTGLDDGRIVRISPDGGETVVVGDGRLLVCDSPRPAGDGYR